jgi:hypothetical protein
VDVYQYPQHVLPRPTKRFHLSEHDCIWNGIHHRAPLAFRFTTGNSHVLCPQWGVIGPARQFSQGRLFYGLVFFFLAGFIAPLVQWILHKRFRFSILKYLNFPVVFSGPGFIPPATPLNYIPWVIIGFIFNYVIRRRHFNWWSKYNCAPISSLPCSYAR